MVSIAHIINPVKVSSVSDLYCAQPVTFESIRRARSFAKHEVSVNNFTAQFNEDRPFVPSDFTATPDLDRSILDLGSFQKERKLPLLCDILDRLYTAADAEYLVYTNVDIALMPSFYTTVAHIINNGYDAFTINRRTISKEFKPEQLTAMYAEIGEPHPGHDCFVFKKELYPKFNVGTACIGANWIGRVLLTNLICYARAFDIFKCLHLTFHLGDDRSWKTHDYADYDNHNERELLAILKNHESAGKLKGKLLVNDFLQCIERASSGGRRFSFKRILNALRRR